MVSIIQKNPKVLLLLRINIKIQNIVFCTFSSIQKIEYCCTLEYNLVMNATESMIFNSQHSTIAHYYGVPFPLQLLMIYRALCQLGVRIRS